jgi:hypothetical protein
VVPALSVEQHWAEKFHAYTRPRETPNSRVRDLVDLALILEHEAPATERVRAAVDATFQRQRTHSVPGRCAGAAVRVGEAVCGSRCRVWTPANTGDGA